MRLPADPEFMAGVGHDLTTGCSGLLIATLYRAVPVGVLLGRAEPAGAGGPPLLEFMRPIPSVAIIPLAILLIPVDELMKISVIVYASVWPILINTLYGMHDVDPLAKESLRSFGFGPLAVLTRVSLPQRRPVRGDGRQDRRGHRARPGRSAPSCWPAASTGSASS
ncbi:hypothetical protein GCM10020220_036740 [Nonomuraea rubra]|uniref:ABC transporter permease n=1 Tax=Nonomuraea rubra TaxID=46180 RepID=UPI0031E86BD6